MKKRKRGILQDAVFLHIWAIPNTIYHSNEEIFNISKFSVKLQNSGFARQFFITNQILDIGITIYVALRQNTYTEDVLV